MKLVWCPDTASKAYIDAVKILSSTGNNSDDTDVAELVAAMAGGWKSQCIVEVSSMSSSSSTTLALSAAARRTGGRHVAVGESDCDVAIDGMDFAVVDFKRGDAVRVLKAARLGRRGAVLVCRNGGGEGGNMVEKWSGVLMEGARVVRAAYLPIGKGGVEIVHVGVGEGKSLSCGRNQYRSRWIKHVDRITGEEHLFRR